MIDNDISCSFGKIMDDSSSSVAVYLERAITAIDSNFEPGYAKNNPILVAAYIQACATENSAAYTVLAAQKIREGFEHIDSQNLAGSIWSLTNELGAHPDIPSDFSLKTEISSLGSTLYDLMESIDKATAKAQ